MTAHRTVAALDAPVAADVRSTLRAVAIPAAVAVLA